MQVTFRNVKRAGSVITAEANHNCGEHLFTVRLAGVVALEQLDNLELFTDPPEYAEEEFAIKGAVSLLHEMLKTNQEYMERAGYVYAMG